MYKAAIPVLYLHRTDKKQTNVNKTAEQHRFTDKTAFISIFEAIY